MLVCDNGSNPLENYDELAKEYFKYFYSTMTAPMANLFIHLKGPFTYLVYPEITKISKRSL